MKWDIRCRALTLAAVLAALVLAAPASASRTQETQFQDDTLLVYPPASEVAATLNTLRSLGVDRIRVSVYWRLVAPNPDSRQRPSFAPGGADDPASYPADKWERYDTIVKLAAERGIAVNFNVTGEAPDWALGTSPDAEVRNVYFPSAGAFGSFVQALGKRYSGSYVPGSASVPTSQGLGTGLPVIGGSTLPPAVAGASGSPLPRVSFWSIWNEPNQSHFLAPQWKAAKVPGGRVEAAPKIYRQLVDTSSRGLAATGHANDTILIGETAPKGRDSKLLKSSLKPLRFIRRLYCVDEKLRPLAGNTAVALGCPTHNQRTEFPRLHPGLFSASGFAHHPYSLLSPPEVQSIDRDYVALADLGRLTSTLATIRSGYGFRGSPPIYYTEFGYQSRPPDPLGYPEATQAAFLNESEFLSYTSPFVRSYQQFLLRDAAPNTQFPRTSLLYWSSFQTGLATLGGHAKQAYGAFRFPLWVPSPARRRGGSFRVWGVVRPARNGSAQTVLIQFKPKFGGSGYRTIKTLPIQNLRNVVDTHVRLLSSGTLRLRWRSINSRAQSIQLG